MADRGVTLRSYRGAFELERRIHRIDRFRIPVPYGVPLVALAYGVATASVVLVAGAVPVFGGLLAAIPWPIRLFFLPALGAHLLCRAGSDGRPAHEVLLARLMFLLSPKHLVGLGPDRRAAVRAVGELAIVPDETSAAYWPGTVVGPARVLLRQPARLTASGRRVEVRQLEDRPMLGGRVVVLPAGRRLVFGCGRC